MLKPLFSTFATKFVPRMGTSILECLSTAGHAINWPTLQHLYDVTLSLVSKGAFNPGLGNTKELVLHYCKNESLGVVTGIQKYAATTYRQD